MRGKETPREIAKRLNDIGPQSKKNEVEGLARSVAHRIAKGDPPPPGYDNWDFAIMQFYRPMKEALNTIKKLAAGGVHK